ncbi:glycosyltransferase family 4 protein [Halomonas sp. CSM-2]|uniref:glycosyltransferase family 4 protein n=1 Tax=Halomonas sp. CSM-2 TaxID=1975722 RepID=UPI0015944FA2|nr:glycosyltransferase family 4 protein [Halomonas sp. CSM-2]
MKILYLHQYFATPDNSGGVRSYQFGKRLAEAGHSVDLVTSTAFFPVARKSWFQLVSQHNIDGIKVHAIHIEYVNQMSFLRRIIAFLLFMIVSSLYVMKLRRHDLIYASSTPLTIAVPALIYKVFRRVPMVFEVRDLWPDIPVELGIIKSKLLIKALYWFERYVYKASKKIVVLSTGMYDELIKKGVKNEKVVVVPNACDIMEFSKVGSSDVAEQLFNQHGQVRLCIYAGTFGYVNNLDYVLDIAVHLKDLDGKVKFILIGDGQEKPHLQRRVEDEGLAEQVVILPAMSKAQLIPYLKASDACLSVVRDIPALYNNSANKFFDALAAGKPIIINHGGWQADVINNNRIGLVLCRNPEKSARKLIDFMARIQDIDAEYILNVARENYSRDKLFTKLCCDALYPAAQL